MQREFKKWCVNKMTVSIECRKSKSKPKWDLGAKNYRMEWKSCQRQSKSDSSQQKSVSLKTGQ